MRRSAVALIVLFGALWASASLAYSGFTVNAIESPAWVERNGARTAISGGDEIRIQDRILTGDSGRIAFQLQPGTDFDHSM